ncbi:transmembrane secretion effector [Nocardioides albertanoniae]|uniref:Transmembrane secretion effector n=1 Tax=Nocardioides albertanoniae TaxID=1175486 RepID=A0A543AAU8_9ACTN|nr:MFS transporter [Nocardioides albertanoniae]TQL69640.1 transmembrane secretion effector [Nocardioides albertanoniae]
MAPISATAPLRQPHFRWFFASRSVNLIGNFMAPVALAFAVMEVSDAPIAIGAVLAARTIPMIIFMLIGGVLADRMGRARILFGSNLVSGLSQAAVAVLVIAGVAELWHLIALAALNGVVSAAGLPAQQGIIPLVVPRTMLQEANVLMSLTKAVVAVAGPGTAGLLVLSIGPGWALAVDALTWIIAALLLIPVKLEGTVVGKASIVGDLRLGWDYFRTTTWLWLCVGAATLLNALYEGGLLTLGPQRAEGSSLGAGGWGLILTFQGLGVLAATLVLMKVRLERPLFVGMLGMALFGLPIAALGFSTDLGVLLPAAAASGAGIQVFSLGWQLSMQENVPADLLSRAASYDQLGTYIAIPVGQLAMGPLAAAYGIERLLAIAGISYIVISLATLLSPAVRRLNRVIVTEPNGAPAH